jgi:hypothetical protein
MKKHPFRVVIESGASKAELAKLFSLLGDESRNLIGI